MRSCAHCEYQNADHLAYCFQCGHRLAAHGRPTATAQLLAGGMPLAAHVGGSLAVAPTMMNRAMAAPATERAAASTGFSGSAVSGPVRATPGWAERAVGNVKYFFAYIRGRWAAEERKRGLGEEKEGAERLLGSAFAELGQTILREGHSAPDLTGLLEAIGRAQARREGAIADLRAAEQLQTAEELRQGRRQDSAQAAVKAAEEALRELDELVKGAEQHVGPDGERARSSPHLDQVRGRRQQAQEGLNRARAQLDEIARDRRQTAAQMSVGLSSHSRERAEAERETAKLTAQLGQAAHQCKLAVPSLKSAMTRIERLESTIAERGRTVMAIDLSMGHYDKRRVAAGGALLLAALVSVATLFWFLVHHRGR